MSQIAAVSAKFSLCDAKIAAYFVAWLLHHGVCGLFADLVKLLVCGVINQHIVIVDD